MTAEALAQDKVQPPTVTLTVATGWRDRLLPCVSLIPVQRLDTSPRPRFNRCGGLEGWGSIILVDVHKLQKRPVRKGFPDAIGTVYPKAQVQLCIIHMARHSLKFVGWKDRKAVAADLKAVYSAPTVEAAEMALDAFEDKWAGRFPSIAKSWRSNWVNLIPFFAYPPEIRKVIYTTNAIESMQSSLRMMTRQRGSFPNPESVRKVMYLALARIAKNWQRPIRDWTAALNRFSVVLEGRI